MTTGLAALRNVCAIADPRCDLGYEYQVCGRCNAPTQECIIFDSRLPFSNEEQPVEKSRLFCRGCWNEVTHRLLTERVGKEAVPQ